MMGYPSNDDLTRLAAEAALMVIREGDSRKLDVTLTFEAKREATGITITNISLGYREPSKNGEGA